VPEHLVAGPAARKGPSVRLDLSGALVKLGPGAADLLGISARPGAAPETRPAVPATPRPATPAAASGADSHAAALTALSRMAGTSSAAKELVALLQETAHDAVTVLSAAEAPGPRKPTHATAQNGNGSAARGNATAAVPATAADGEVLSRTSLDVSVEDMPYLLDHCFFAQPDDWPRVEDRWPVVPATTMVQFMMDVAEQAVPGLKAIGVREAKFSRWLKAAPPQRVDVTVKQAGPNLLSVALGGYARSLIEVGTSYPEPPARAWAQDPATEFPPSISAEQMYAERLMFHGPQFQGRKVFYQVRKNHLTPLAGTARDRVRRAPGRSRRVVEMQLQRR